MESFTEIQRQRALAEMQWRRSSSKGRHLDRRCRDWETLAWIPWTILQVRFQALLTNEHWIHSLITTNLFILFLIFLYHRHNEFLYFSFHSFNPETVPELGFYLFTAGVRHFFLHNNHSSTQKKYETKRTWAWHEIFWNDCQNEEKKIKGDLSNYKLE